jgi:hypothetical protein
MIVDYAETRAALDALRTVSMSELHRVALRAGAADSASAKAITLGAFTELRERTFTKALDAALRGSTAKWVPGTSSSRRAYVA